MVTEWNNIRDESIILVIKHLFPIGIGTQRDIPDLNLEHHYEYHRVTVVHFRFFLIPEVKFAKRYVLLQRSEFFIVNIVTPASFELSNFSYIISLLFYILEDRREYCTIFAEVIVYCSLFLFTIKSLKDSSVTVVSQKIEAIFCRDQRAEPSRVCCTSIEAFVRVPREFHDRRVDRCQGRESRQRPSLWRDDARLRWKSDRSLHDEEPREYAEGGKR